MCILGHVHIRVCTLLGCVYIRVCMCILGYVYACRVCTLLLLMY